MSQSKTLAIKLAEKRASFNTIFEKGDAATDAEVSEAKSIREEILSLESQHAEAVKNDEFAAANKKALDEMKNTPTNPIVHSTGDRMQFQGFGNEAGKSYIEDGRIVGEEGFGLDQKTYQAISEKAYTDAFRSYLKKGERGLTSNEIKDLQVGTDTDGGFLVPAQFMNKLIERKPTPTRVAERVTRYQTSSDRLELPKNTYSADDLYTTPMRVTWTGEVPTSSTQHKTETPKTGLVTIPIHTAMISAEVTRNMLEDGSFNVLNWLQRGFRETDELLKDNMVINGSGIGQPAGILLNPGGDNQPSVVPLGHASQITPDGIIDLAYSVPEQYDENCAFVFNKTNTGRAIAKLKDADNRYLFNAGAGRDGVASARPTDLVGYNYFYSGFMPNIAANAFPMIFGDLQGYYLVERIGFSIEVLHEIQALSNKKVLLGRLRFGGQVCEDWRLKIGKVATN